MTKDELQKKYNSLVKSSQILVDTNFDLNTIINGYKDLVANLIATKDPAYVGRVIKALDKKVKAIPDYLVELEPIEEEEEKPAFVDSGW